MNNLQYLIIGVITIFLIWTIIAFFSKKQAVAIPSVEGECTKACTEKKNSIDDKEWEDFINANPTTKEEEVLPPINLEPTADDFAESHMGFEIKKDVIDFEVVKETPEYKQEIDETTEKVKAFLTEVTPEQIAEAVAVKVKSEIALEKSKKKSPKVKKESNVFDKKLYTFGDKGIGDFQIGIMVLWNNKISKVTKIEGKKAYICTFIKNEETCKFVNVSSLAITTLK